jgi:hypothetical protein
MFPVFSLQEKYLSSLPIFYITHCFRQSERGELCSLYKCFNTIIIIIIISNNNNNDDQVDGASDNHGKDEN